MILGFGYISANAEEFRVPALRAAVNDEAGMLTPASREKMEAALRFLKRESGTQIAVLTIPTLSGLSIEQASIQIVDKWKLGSEKEDKGVLLLLAKKEHRMRIEVGQGLEGRLTDAYSKRIIDERMAPLLRADDPDSAVLIGVYEIARISNPDVDLRPYLQGALRGAAGPRRGSSGSPLGTLIFLLLAIPLSLLRFGLFGGLPFYHRRSGYYWGGGLGGGGFSGGGGFGGFSGGGGGFSGGGASGGW